MDYLLSNPALFPVLSYVCVPVLCLIDWIELSKISLSLYLIPQNCCAMLSCSVVSNSLWPPGSSVHGDSPGKNTGVGCHALLQGIFLCVKRQIHHFAEEGPNSQSYGLSSSQVWILRVGLYRRLSMKELMLSNCDTGEDSWESLGLHGDQTS